MKNFLDNKFKISSRKSTIKTELIAGLVSYLAMSYIIFVNPSILGQAGINEQAVFVATIFASFIATFIMGWFANYPLGLAPCMSMNAFFTYTVVLNMGLSWQDALACVFLSSLLFIGLSFTKFRFQLIESIPDVIKNSATVGLGLFIAMTGMKNSSIITINDNLISFGTFENPNVVIAWIGILVAAILMVKKNKYSVIISLFAAVLVGLVYQLLLNLGYITIPEQYIGTLPTLPDKYLQNPMDAINTMLDTTFLVAPKNVVNVLTISGIGVVLSFLFLDFFGTAATLSAANSKLKDVGLSENNKKVYLADSFGTFFGSLLGTSNVTTYIESVSGINSGGRTGLSALATAFLFLISIVLFPFLDLITSAVTTPALVTIGVVMLSSVTNIDWHQGYEKTIPAFLTIVLMPFIGSIALGLTFGFISYGILMTVAKRSKEIDKTLWFIIIISAIYVISTMT